MMSGKAIMEESGQVSLYEGLQELKGRLPHVPETILTHFLSQLNGNIERCYEELKDRKWDLNRQPEELSSLLLEEPMDRNVGHTTTDRNIDHTTPHTDTTHASHHLRRTMTYPDSSSPPLDLSEDNQDMLQRTWPRSLHWRTRPMMNYAGASPVYPSDLSFMRSPLSPSLHSLGPMALPPMHGSPPGLSSMNIGATGIARHHPIIQDPNTGVLTTMQKQQLEHICKVQEELVHHISMLRSQADAKKLKLSKLRVEVLEGPTQQDVNSIQDVITTLQYDIQSEKRKIEIQKSQNEMKENREIYTEEGVRWQCSHCTFLNHPLMSRCESCDLPKINSRQGTVQS